MDKTIFELCKENFSPDLVRQTEEPVYYVDFLREPTVDDDTGRGGGGWMRAQVGGAGVT